MSKYSNLKKRLKIKTRISEKSYRNNKYINFIHTLECSLIKIPLKKKVEIN